MSNDTQLWGILLTVIIYGLFGAWYLALCHYVGKYWKESRGRSYGNGFLLSLLVTPLVGWVVGMLLQADQDRLAERQVEAGALKKCPFCAEAIRGEATVCRFCGKEQPTTAPQSPPASARAGKPRATGTGSSKRVIAIVVAGPILLVVTIFVLVLKLGPSNGALVVTSHPTNVELFLDGAKIGDRTPLTREDIPVGPHVLVARAPGYADRAYRFDIAADVPAVVQVELGASGAAVGQDAVGAAH